MDAHLSVACEIDLQRLGIVLEAQRCHCEQDILAIDRLSFLLLALLGRFDHISEYAQSRVRIGMGHVSPPMAILILRSLLRRHKAVMSIDDKMKLTFACDE